MSRRPSLFLRYTQSNIFTVTYNNTHVIFYLFSDMKIKQSQTKQLDVQDLVFRVLSGRRIVQWLRV
jgi:hypothetical protein